MYIQKQELRSMLNPTVMNQITGGEDGIIESAIEEARACAESYLKARYDTQAIFAATGDDRNLDVVHHIKVIAVWYLLIRSHVETLLDKWEKEYLRSIEYFKGLLSGRPAPDLPLLAGCHGGVAAPYRSGSINKFNHGSGFMTGSPVCVTGNSGSSGPSGGTPGPQGPPGADGADGFNGWSPVLTIARRGDDRVLIVSEWIGGSGDKPDAGVFVSLSGYTDDIDQAENVRGIPGYKGDDGADGREIELQAEDGKLYWRYAGDGDWVELWEIPSGGASEVVHDSTLAGTGTEDDPLTVNGAVLKDVYEFDEQNNARLISYDYAKYIDSVIGAVYVARNTNIKIGKASFYGRWDTVNSYYLRNGRTLFLNSIYGTGIFSMDLFGNIKDLSSTFGLTGQGDFFGTDRDDYTYIKTDNNTLMRYDPNTDSISAFDELNNIPGNYVSYTYSPYNTTLDIVKQDSLSGNLIHYIKESNSYYEDWHPYNSITIPALNFKFYLRSGNIILASRTSVSQMYLLSDKFITYRLITGEAIRLNTMEMFDENNLVASSSSSKLYRLMKTQYEFNCELIDDSNYYGSIIRMNDGRMIVNKNGFFSIIKNLYDIPETISGRMALEFSSYAVGPDDRIYYVTYTVFGYIDHDFSNHVVFTFTQESTNVSCYIFGNTVFFKNQNNLYGYDIKSRLYERVSGAWVIRENQQHKNPDIIYDYLKYKQP